ncbi:hypothetical protein Daura_14190 [Dactylosporangium aurantiacum]|uniref:WXG100 family type VII secretion target n=1 Tax=Dactylosporangium aurantiacum TaxID=35754 RepID=A0A9Q9IQ08_9ACTN|nr:WXG100 family type VII secretion target [Dactylosporangium aurantiacum]MDG6108542.1 WXG100 family type VII secretion target [Dactylosporangium aurantiacum]UWZ57210.1 hypothetical protein Daura_14190 [Dactylosporangium aurantiacum]
MGNEYTAHYAGKSHRELYDQLMAGDPGQVEGVATDWHTAATTARHIASEIEKDLLKLDWKGDAGQEYRHRLGLVSTFSGGLADDQGEVKKALNTIGAALRTAQKNADNPEDTDDSDSMWGGAAIGGATFGLPGALVGGYLGHERDEQQKKEAKERMVKLMADLAVDYAVNNSTILEPLPPPVELPGGDPGNTSDPKGGPGGSVPRKGPGVNTFGNVKTSTTDAVGTVSTGPGGNGGGDPSQTVVGQQPTGTSLLGVETGVVGAGALVAGTALAGQIVTLGGGGPTLGISTGLASSVPPGGVLGQPGAGRGDGGATTGQRGSTGSLRESTGRTAGARPGAERGPGAGRANRMGVPGRDGMFGQQRGTGAAARGNGDGDEEERYDTWLTEDDMVWSDDEQAPPPVLGGSEPPPPPAS